MQLHSFDILLALDMGHTFFPHKWNFDELYKSSEQKNIHLFQENHMVILTNFFLPKSN